MFVAICVYIYVEQRVHKYWTANIVKECKTHKCIQIEKNMFYLCILLSIDLWNIPLNPRHRASESSCRVSSQPGTPHHVYRCIGTLELSAKFHPQICEDYSCNIIWRKNAISNVKNVTIEHNVEHIYIIIINTKIMLFQHYHGSKIMRSCLVH